MIQDHRRSEKKLYEGVGPVKTYAIWFEDSDIKKVLDVTDHYRELTTNENDERAANIVREETGASVVVGGNTVQEAIVTAAEMFGVDALGGVLPRLLGVTEVGRELGWDRAKVATYRRRGALPEPAVVVGNRPFWTERQIIKYKQEAGRL